MSQNEMLEAINQAWLIMDDLTNNRCDEWKNKYAHYLFPNHTDDKKPAVILCCKDWINAGMGDECFWEEWDECPTEIQLTPKMILDAINEK